MSTIPADQIVDVDETSPYAPKRIREAARAAKLGVEPPNSEGLMSEGIEGASLSEVQTSSFSDDAPQIESFSLPLALEPPPVSGAKFADAPRSLLHRVWRPSLAAAVLGGIAFLVGRSLMWAGDPIDSVGEPHHSWSQTIGQTPVNARHVKSSDAKLSLDRVAPGRPGEAMPLGASARDLGEGGLVVVSGFADGTTLSAGSPVGDNSWWLSASVLKQVRVQPPPHFVGAMSASIELRLADTVLLDRKSIRLEWIDEQAAEKTPADATVHSLAPDQIAALLKRGEDLIASGDPAAARLVLQRAARAGDARAAMTIAATYDPLTIEKLGVHGLSPDIVLARQWYETAKRLGAPEASKRLETLASRP
jgi:hypothetical protein